MLHKKVFPGCPPTCYEEHYKCVLCSFGICAGEDIASWRGLNSEQVRAKVAVIHQELRGVDHTLIKVKRAKWA